MGFREIHNHKNVADFRNDACIRRIAHAGKSVSEKSTSRSLSEKTLPSVRSDLASLWAAV